MKGFVYGLVIIICITGAGFLLTETTFPSSTGNDVQAFAAPELQAQHVQKETPFLFLNEFQNHLSDDKIALDVTSAKRVQTGTGNLLILVFELNNHKNQQVRVKPSQFALQVYGEDGEYKLYQSKSADTEKGIPPGETLTGTLTYKVKESNGYLLMYRPDRHHQDHSVSFLLYESALCH